MRAGGSSQEDALLAAVAVLLGALVAGAYAAYRALSLDSGGRGAAFAGAMLWPGVLIAAAVATMVWLGWKLKID